MVISQMDNPFAIGDLVHIPSGVVLYSPIKLDIIKERKYAAKAVKALEKPSVGLVLNRDFSDYYKVSIGQDEFLLKKEDMVLIRKGGK
jgi:hypothetical protein